MREHIFESKYETRNMHYLFVSSNLLMKKNEQQRWPIAPLFSNNSVCASEIGIFACMYSTHVGIGWESYEKNKESTKQHGEEENNTDRCIV